MAWALVTPSSRGIGHALTRHLLLTTPPTVPIVATARTSLPEVRASLIHDIPESCNPSRLDLQPCDLTSESSIEALASHCRERYNITTSTSTSSSSNPPTPHLRTAICLPGLLHPERSPSQITHSTSLQTLTLNLLAPLLLAKHLSPLLPRKSQLRSHPLTPIAGLHPTLATLAFMSARVGSISDNKSLGGWYSYRASKAGVNQLVKTLDLHLKMSSGRRSGSDSGSVSGAQCVGLHPGTVKTDLSRDFWSSTPKEKLFEPEFAAGRLCEVLAGLPRDGSGGGRCWDWKGEEILP